MVKQDTMKIVLPEIRQLGVVVKDVEKAIEYYSSNFSLGPFETRTITRSSAIIRGKKVDYKT